MISLKLQVRPGDKETLSLPVFTESMFVPSLVTMKFSSAIDIAKRSSVSYCSLVIPYTCSADARRLFGKWKSGWPPGGEKAATLADMSAWPLGRMKNGVDGAFRRSIHHLLSYGLNSCVPYPSPSAHRFEERATATVTQICLQVEWNLAPADWYDTCLQLLCIPVWQWVESPFYYQPTTTIAILSIFITQDPIELEGVGLLSCVIWIQCVCAESSLINLLHEWSPMFCFGDDYFLRHFSTIRTWSYPIFFWILALFSICNTSKLYIIVIEIIKDDWHLVLFLVCTGKTKLLPWPAKDFTS